MTKAEERILFAEIQDDGLLPIHVLALPEKCQYIYTDRYGQEWWRGKIKTYILIKRA